MHEEVWERGEDEEKEVWVWVEPTVSGTRNRQLTPTLSPSQPVEEGVCVEVGEGEGMRGEVRCCRCAGKWERDRGAKGAVCT